MAAYYNENDPNAAAWLRELIAKGLIAPGDVDTRSIVDVRPDDLAGYVQCHFFAGIGVWSHALRTSGWADDRPVWTGSCPCQPFSAAGKGGGFDDARHLWPVFFRLIAECRPDLVLGEQVASKDGLGWLDLVHADLEGADYAVGAVDTCAAGFGAPHIRQRLWWCGAAQGMDHSAGPRHIGSVGDTEGAARDQARLRVSGVGGEAGWLADAIYPVGRPDMAGGNDSGRADAGWPQDSGDAGIGSGSGGVANAQRERVRTHRSRGALGPTRAMQEGEWEWERVRPDAGPVDDGLLRLHRSSPRHSHPGPASDTQHQPDRLDDDHGDRTGQAVGGVHLGRSQPHGGQLRPGPANGWWAAPDWLHCRDGRWRAVESGTFPLVDGAPARVGRLRGYGNAIVAPQAQAFVEAVMEAVR